MDVSVAIASRNGSRLLARVIRAMRASLDQFSGEAELLLVDSASTDRTLQIMEAAAAEDPRIRVVPVPQPGLSHARNAAVEAAKGEALLFTDDDVFVPETWVTDMVRALSHAEAVTGTVRLAEDVRVGLTRFQRELLADTDAALLGDPPRTIIGASMGLRRSVFDGGRRFNEKLGAGTNLGFCEETLLHLELTAAGGRTAFVGSAPVEHHVDQSRVSDEMFRRRVKQQAAAEVWMSWHYLGVRPTPRQVLQSAKANVRVLGQRARGRRSGGTDEELGRLRRASYLRAWIQAARS